MPRLTARSLELFTSMKGCGKAANEISKAVGVAHKQAVKDYRYERKKNGGALGAPRIARIIEHCHYEIVHPVLLKWSHFGAADTEPRWNSTKELARRVLKDLGWDDDWLQASVFCYL